jgi:hypothetical protein
MRNRAPALRAGFKIQGTRYKVFVEKQDVACFRQDLET